MHINTKVVFEWDQDKQEYLEVYSEGYEYSGDLILATSYDDVVASCRAAGGTKANCKLEANAQGYFPYGEEQASSYYEAGGEGYGGIVGQDLPTGYQDYQSLWDLSQEGGMTGYLESQFKIGPDYEQYITPFDDKPFEFLEAGLGLEKKGLRTAMETATSATATGLREAGGAVGTAYAQSNMANVGGITQGFKEQKDKLMKELEKSRTAYGLGMKQAQLGYKTDVYGEQKTQEERFYDDITGIIQMKG